MTVMRETERDLIAERQIADMLGNAWKCGVEKMAAIYRLDFALRRDLKIVSYFEAKRRYHTFGTYPTVYVSLRKVQGALSLRDACGLPCFFVGGFDDVLAYADLLAMSDFDCEWRGRSDTNDPDDYEPVKLVPVSAFKILKVRPTWAKAVAA